jgi:hypothetical protein
MIFDIAPSGTIDGETWGLKSRKLDVGWKIKKELHRLSFRTSKPGEEKA